MQLQYTIGEPLNQTLSAGGYQFSMGFGQPQPNLAVNSISSSPFCAGSSITVSFTANDILDSVNVFTLQLSDSLGNFFYPITLATDTSRFSGTITATIPFNLTGGTNYRVMVVASGASDISDFSAPFTINIIGVPNNIHLQSICSDTAYTFTFDSITAGSGGNEVEWSADSTFSSLHFIAAGANVSMAVAAGSDSIIWVRSVDSLSGCYSQPEKVIVEVNKNPIDTAANTGPYCYEGTIALSATPANFRDYVWSGPDPTFSSITSNTTLPAAGNAGTYTITVTDFNGCTATASTTVSVNSPIAPPSTPASQSTCSDTALTFTFLDTLGTGGNQLQWATNSMFLNTQISNTPLSVPLTVGAGGNITLYIRSADSTSGCTSVPVTATATVYALPFPLRLTVSLDTICPTGSTNILIPNSENGKNYLLQVGDSTIAMGYGTGYTISLNTGAVDSNTTFTVLAIDTLTGCYRQLQSAITVYVDSIIPAPAFIAGDTILYTDERIKYTAVNLNGSMISYFIDTGFATIDTLSGLVSAVSSDFDVQAKTAPVPGCQVSDAHLPVQYSDVPLPPAIPQSQSAWSDTAVTFTLVNIKPGRGADQVEWARDSLFTISYIISDSGSISLTVDTNTTDTVYMRSKNNRARDAKGNPLFSASSAVLATLWVRRLPNGVTGITSNPVVYYPNLTPPSINQSNAIGITPAYGSASPSGGLSYTVPIACPAGSNGMTPQISLIYNSQGGDGMLGWGWGLSGLSTISRSGLDNFHDQQVTPISLTNTDPFNLDGMRLTVKSGINGADGATYFKEVEDYSTIESKGSYGADPASFLVTTKQGLIMEYGQTPDSRFYTNDGTGISHILQWKLDKITDPNGNFMTFIYDQADGSPKIKEIDYTGNNNSGGAPYAAIFFNYELRSPDANISFTCGTPSYNKHLLTSIISKVNNAGSRFKEYDLDYTLNDVNWLLHSVTEFGTGTAHLNPTVFQYGAAPDDKGYTAISSSFDKIGYSSKSLSQGQVDNYRNFLFNTNSSSKTEISGDFNGDGYSDILTLYQATNFASVAAGEVAPYNLAFTVSYMSPTTHEFLPVATVNKDARDVTFTPAPIGSGLATSYSYSTDHENYDYFVGDFLGLGRDGILEVEKQVNENDAELPFRHLTIGSIKYYTLDPSGNVTTTVFSLPPHTDILPNTGYISIGDFDGDGKLDIILYMADYTYISFPSKNIFNAKVGNLGMGGSYNTQEAGAFMSSYVINFYGDGKSNLLAIEGTGSTVWSLGSYNTQYNFYEFNASNFLSFPKLGDINQIYLADINGDGKTDIITGSQFTQTPGAHISGSHPHPNSTNYGSPFTPVLNSYEYSGDTWVDASVDNKWNIAYSTGTSFSVQNNPFLEMNFIANNCEKVEGGVCYTGDGTERTYYGKLVPSKGLPIYYNTEAEYLNAINSAQQLVVGDFNGDGRSDVFFTSGAVGNCNSAKMFYSTGSALLGYDVFEGVAGLQVENSVVGDFNGDGRSDLSFYNIIKGAGCSRPNGTLVNDDYYQLSFNPFGQERLLQKATDGFLQTQSFAYLPLTDPTIHMLGNNNFIIPPSSLPSPGFNPDPVTSAQPAIYVLRAVTVPDGIGGAHSTTYNYVNALVHHSGRGFIGFEKINSVSSALNISTQVITSYASPYYCPTNIFQQSNIGTEQLGASSVSFAQTLLQPNHYTVFKTSEGNTNEITGAFSVTNYTPDAYGNVYIAATSIQGGLETNTVTTSFQTPFHARPSSIFICKTRQGSSAYSSSSNMFYYGNGNLLETLPSEACAPTFSYSYDDFGNPLQQNVSVSGQEGRSQRTYFDYQGRFIGVVYNALNQATVAQNDPNWGKPVFVTGIDNNFTTYTYDDFGRPTNIVPPRGSSNTISIQYNWDININGLNSIYSINTSQPHKPTVIVWYDAMGREVQREMTGFDNNRLVSSTTYTSLNKPATITKAHYSSETSPSFKTYSYDFLNRPINILDQFNNNTTINYLCGLGNTKTTTTDAAGHTSIQTTDAAGKLVSSGDNAGMISFSYDGFGNQVEARGPSGTITTKYDPCNHKKYTTEPNSGTYQYCIDGYGDLLKQVDDAGRTYTMQYDVLGRMTEKTGPEGISSFTYNPSGTNGVNKIATVTGFDEVYQYYTYNSFSDLTESSEVINAVAYNTTYTYDGYGQLQSTTYPSNLKIDYTPDASGYYLKSINEDAGPTLYTANAMNSYGQATSYTLGNGITSTLTTNYSIPLNYSTTSSNIQNLSLSYDWPSGDLTGRQDNSASSGTHPSESFNYDASDRLIQAQVAGSSAMNYAFSASGNITSKTDVGGYDYDPTKTNAVMHVSNEPGNISNNTQNITYIGDNKASVITENGYELDYTYAADFSRKYSVLKSGGSTVNTRVYCGNYEENDSVASGNIQKIHYIYANNGLAAIIVIDNSGKNEYYTYTDQLGSIVTVTNSSSTIVAQQNFDAWGRNRNPKDWSYSSIPGVPNWLFRGYCGHEMLPQFALINMNGRMYDPLLGRMLSPDNGVQTPAFTQSYNRFSYCGNNPLKYTDPTGWNRKSIIAPLAYWQVAHGFDGLYGTPSPFFLNVGGGVMESDVGNSSTVSFSNTETVNSGQNGNSGSWSTNANVASYAIFTADFQYSYTNNLPNVDQANQGQQIDLNPASDASPVSFFVDLTAAFTGAIGTVAGVLSYGAAPGVAAFNISIAGPLISLSLSAESYKMSGKDATDGQYADLIVNAAVEGLTLIVTTGVVAGTLPATGTVALTVLIISTTVGTVEYSSWISTQRSAGQNIENAIPYIENEIQNIASYYNFYGK